MVATQRIKPAAWNYNHNHGKKKGRRDRKMYVGVHVAKKRGEGEWRTTQKHPAAIQLFNFGRGGETEGRSE